MRRPHSAMSGRKQERRSLCLGLELTHFGPIKHADIRVAPLTVLIGPNNSGKSFFAMALHALIRWHAASPFERLLRSARALRNSGSGSEAAALDITSVLETLLAKGAVDIPESAIQRYSIDATTGGLDSHLSGLYQAPPSDLRAAWGKKRLRARLRWRRGSVALSVNRDGCMVEGIEAAPVRVVLDDALPLGEIELPEQDGASHFVVARERVRAELEEHRTDEEPFMSMLLPTLARRWATDGLPLSTHYLPAGRSGIMQAYDSIVAAVLQGAAEAPFGVDIPRVPGAAAEFLTVLVSRWRSERRRATRRRSTSPVDEAIAQFEATALNGEVTIDFTDTGPVPTFTYRSPIGDLPLVRASSSVLEVAPLSVYLRGHVGEGDLLIIEEPEAHLHPANQRRMARLLAALIRAGVFVLITTHSDYLVEQLRALRMAGELPADERAEVLDETPEAYLRGDELGIYLFDGAYDDAGEFVGSTARELPWRVTDDDEPGYYEQVDQALYDELTTLERRITAKD